MATYTILASFKNEVSKKIKHIMNKCVRNNVPCSYKVGEPYSAVYENVNHEKFEVSVVDIDVDVKFKYNGWKSLGVVQRKDGIVQCYFDDLSLIKDYCDTDFRCDHCNKKIRRNSVVVLENDNGERKVVGTSCVKEFTRGLDGNLVAEFNEYKSRLIELEDELTHIKDHDIDGTYSRCCTKLYKVDRVVSCAINLVNQYGFVPSGYTDSTSTAVLKCLDSMCTAALQRLNDNVKIEDEAIRAIEWVKSLSEDELHASSYLFNLRKIVDEEYCSARFFGILVAIVPTFRKHEHNRLMNEQREANNKVSNYIGNVGDKISETVTYITSYSYESQFGYGYFHIFYDDSGNVIKWSTGNGVDANKGDKVILSGKIKGHEEYRGEKQTVLTRCKVSKIAS